MESADVCNSYKEKSDFEVTDRQNTWRLRTVTAKMSSECVNQEGNFKTNKPYTIYIYI